jgi:TonB family protein
VNARNAYFASSLGHAGILAIGFALSSLVRGPAIVPGVHIVLGGASAPAGGGKKIAPAPPVKPASTGEKPKAEVEPVPAPPRKKPVEKAPPERMAPKLPDARGTKPQRDAGIVSKAPSEVAVAGSRAQEPARGVASGASGEAASAGRGGRGEVGIEAEGEMGPAAGYLSLLRERVANAWEPPISIDRTGEARVVVTFTVVKTGGRPEEVAVQTSSGVALYDRRALAAVADASPLPPIPSHLGFGSIVIRFTFTQSY